MSYLELLLESPGLFFIILLISFAITVLVYGAFPIIFAKAKKTPISQRKYKGLCYGINAIGLVFFIVLNGSVSGGPYLLWTWVFSRYGAKILESKFLLIDGHKPTKENSTSNNTIHTQSTRTTVIDTSVTENKKENYNNSFSVSHNIIFCRKCGVKLPEDSLFCTRCGTKVITDIDQKTCTLPTEEKIKNKIEEQAKQEGEKKVECKVTEKVECETEEKNKYNACENTKKQITLCKKEKTLFEKLEYALKYQTDDGMISYLKNIQDKTVQDILKSPSHLIRDQIKNLLSNMQQKAVAE